MGVSEKRSLRAKEYRLQMIRLVEVFCATRRHQKTKTKTKRRQRFAWLYEEIFRASLGNFTAVITVVTLP